VQEPRQQQLTIDKQEAAVPEPVVPEENEINAAEATKLAAIGGGAS